MEEELWLLLLGLGAGGVAAAVNRRVMKAAAFGYVALTEGLGRVVIPIRDRWRAAVEEARQEREQQEAAAGGSPRRVRRRQQHGEHALRASAGVAGEAAAQGAAQG